MKINIHPVNKRAITVLSFVTLNNMVLSQDQVHVPGPVLGPLD